MISNRTIICRDNLEVLYLLPNKSIDLIYLDPPFKKDKKFHAPTGSSAKGASFDDVWSKEKLKDQWIKLINKDHNKLKITFRSYQKYISYQIL